MHDLSLLPAHLFYPYHDVQERQDQLNHKGLTGLLRRWCCHHQTWFFNEWPELRMFKPLRQEGKIKPLKRPAFSHPATLSPCRGRGYMSGQAFLSNAFLKFFSFFLILKENYRQMSKNTGFPSLGATLRVFCATTNGSYLPLYRPPRP